MADELVVVPILQIVYNVMIYLCTNLWNTNRGLLLAAYVVRIMNVGLVKLVFAPTIDSISDLMMGPQGLMAIAATIAIFLLGMGYLLAPYAKIQVVSPKKAIAWLLFAMVFYNGSGTLYTQLDEAKDGVTTLIQGTVLNQASGLNGLNMPANADEGMRKPGAEFGEGQITSIDVAAAYFYANRADVFGTEYSVKKVALPGEFKTAFFPDDIEAIHYKDMGLTQRSVSMAKAMQGINRQLSGPIVISFAILDQLVQTLLNLAFALLFINIAVALPLALFEITEPLARGALDACLRLFLFTIIAGILQATILGVITRAADTANSTALLAATVVGIFLSFSLLTRSMQAVGSSMNQTFASASQVIGGKLLSPGEVGSAVASGVGQVALAAVTGGASAAVTLAAGGTAMQAVGSAFSGSEMLYSASAMGAMTLPDSSPMKGTVSEMYEGALASRMLGPAGGLLLGAQNKAQTKVDDDPNTAHASLAVSQAVQQAQAQAPSGGYASQAEGWHAILDALKEAGITRDPHVDRYLNQNAPNIIVQVMDGHATATTDASTGSGQAPSQSAPSGSPVSSTATSASQSTKGK